MSTGQERRDAIRRARADRLATTGNWEQRMAAQAAVRESRRRTREQELVDAEHAGHHSHLQGTCVVCSCGHFFGVICVAYGEDHDPAKLSCTICGEVGVVRIGDEEQP